MSTCVTALVMSKLYDDDDDDIKLVWYLLRA